jgi:hypothetical protein
MSDDITSTTAPEDGEMVDTAPVLDEAAFIKTAKRRSTLRIVAVAGALIVAVLIAILAGVIGWDRAFYEQANHVREYYPALVSISSPNTRLMWRGIPRSRFPGGVMEYAAYRRVGDVLIPAGEAFVEFNLWGSEQTHGAAERMAYAGSRKFSGSDLTPMLRLLEPAGRGGAATKTSPEVTDMAKQTLAELASHTDSSLKRLSAAPPSSTVEVAVSFGHALTLKEVEGLVGPNLRLSWGATDATPHPPVPFEPEYGQMVGVDFAPGDAPYVGAEDITDQEKEDHLIESLGQIASHAPEGTADRCRASAAYLEKNGVRYFGIVACGSPSAALELAHRPGVTAVSLGAVVPPWQ